MPQLADTLQHLETKIPLLCSRADEGERLVGLDGSRARRAVGLNPADWESLHAWFIGRDGRRADADNVRRLATDAMRALLANLRRIVAGADREQSRYADMVRLAGWFDRAEDERAHQLWAATFGVYSARHLGFAADDDDDPVPATASWWHTPVADVPMALRVHGERTSGGRTGARADYSEAKHARLEERRRVQVRRSAATRELADHVGELDDVHLGDDARAALLDLYSQALARHGRPLGEGSVARAAVPLDEEHLDLTVVSAPGHEVRIISPQGRLVFVDLGLCLALDPQADRSEAVS